LKKKANRNFYIWFKDINTKRRKRGFKMALFGMGKKKSAPSPETPTAKVLQMRQQGYSNDQIIQLLQQEGFRSSQIFDALSQADIKETAGGIPQQQPAPAPALPPEYQQMPAPEPLPPEMPPLPEMPPAMPPLEHERIDKESIAEIAESIVDEKWEELMKSVDKIVAWKDEAETRIAKMEQKIKDLKERFEALHAGILSKVSEYDKGIKTVGTDVKAMEEAFKKILPTLTANVSELSRLTKKIKPKKQ